MPTATHVEDPDVILIGSGVMSANLGAMLKRLDPRLSIQLYEDTQRGQAVPTRSLNQKPHHLGQFRFSTPKVRPDPIGDSRVGEPCSQLAVCVFMADVGHQVFRLTLQAVNCYYHTPKTLAISPSRRINLSHGTVFA